MIFEIKIPSPGESITEVEIGKWLANDGSYVNVNQEIAEIESDKATLSIAATSSGILRILVKEGEKATVGSVACTIDSDDSIQPASNASILLNRDPQEKSEAEAPSKYSKLIPEIANPEPEVLKAENSQIKITPAAKAVMKDSGLSIDDIVNGLRRIVRKDVEAVLGIQNEISVGQTLAASRDIEKIPMSPLRRKLSQRLVAVKNETAMLTTFNEIDMTELMELRKKYQQPFLEKYGYKIGFMSFFTKAASSALSSHPTVNSLIEGDEILTPKFHDIGIAVQTPKGLMVPVIRNVETKSISSLEGEIKELAEKARDKKLTVQEMTGGTFTITNGGVFGSLMSTPIINPPQSAILGMHSIKDRPIAVNGKVEIRPMMYVALSYDHRLIDGKDSVGFLVKIKELIENPSKLLFNGKSEGEILLGL